MLPQSHARPIDSHEPERGEQIGEYTVRRRVGQGGMGTVFEAIHGQLGRVVALKLLSPRIASQPNAVARFIREARVVSELRHPHVVAPIGVGTWRELPYFVMEFLDGVTLAEHLRTRGRLGVSETADLVLPIISAIATAHASGIVHRDLKPSNVLLPRRGGALHPMVVDFGIAKRQDEQADPITAPDAVIGTVEYMAPEQLRGASRAGPSSDLYSLGVLLYQCVTGRLPFRETSTCETIAAVLTADVTSPRRWEPALPEAFETVVMRAMHRDAAARFASVHALGRALLPFASARAALLWSDELGSAGPQHDGFTASDGDVPPPGGTRLESAPVRAPGPRVLRRVSLFAAAVSVSAFVVVASSRSQAEDSAAAVARVGRVAPRERTLAITRDVLAAEPPVASPMGVASAQPAAPPRRRIAPAPPATLPAPSAPSVPSAAPAPNLLGPNDAPILE